MQKQNEEKKLRPEQKQRRPGKESKMRPVPHTEPVKQQNKLDGKVALITGGDSGIGKATALLFAANGADIAIAYLSETDDAKATQKEIREMGKECLLIRGDLSKEVNCKKAVDKTIDKFSKLDILVNNAALHWETESLEEISTDQLERTFANNVFSYFWVTKYALRHLKEGSAIVNTSSVTAYRGSGKLIDYSATKGAIISFTRSLAQSLAPKKIRVNAVAPGPIWTPLIVSTFDEKRVAEFGSDTPLGRAGEPSEVAPCFLFLASDDSTYITGQCLHPNGGEIVNA
ncbi:MULTISPECIES: glucose 1-dehydrogenase [Proteiniphilum]|uniref:glucose 1-dehydrogenase n=1 Tax=Proteiniphilum TaxID=294702 RepID=UPI00037C4338|nr:MULTISPECIES: glucose 1-dehydrogenase [Proteiniphilum]RNC63769.1 glucose 1-dehydrogenase [Proteiniphilum sp. X52]SFL22165.1 NAD(P)-dependent dehydrogenase, short-chain alcohol dehydrogenase family [Porphyromonadaceae bacterium KH3CP3RA]